MDDSFVAGEKYKIEYIPTDCTAQINAKSCYRWRCNCDERHRQADPPNQWDCVPAITTEDFTLSLVNPIIFK